MNAIGIKESPAKNACSRLHFSACLPQEAGVGSAPIWDQGPLDCWYPKESKGCRRLGVEWIALPEFTLALAKMRIIIGPCHFRSMSRYRLYFDESGVHSSANTETVHGRYLALCGVIFKEEDYSKFQIEWEAMKRSFFAGDPDEPIVLRRKEIMGKSGLFSVLEDDQIRAAFDAQLLRIMAETTFKSLIVVIDKASHRDQYKSPLNAYHYCLVALLQRYCYWLGSRKGDVMGESRGKVEDQQLKAAYASLYSNGDWHQRAKFYQSRLTSGDIKLYPKFKNIAGLQLADLLAHPAKMRCLVNNGIKDASEGTFGKQVADVFWTKIRRASSGNAKGYGEMFI
jgi:hypothetical protein